jgi:hypothetical protein
MGIVELELRETMIVGSRQWGTFGGLSEVFSCAMLQLEPTERSVR